MRVALCADGRSPHTYRWANAVADRGHEVALVWESQDLPGADLSRYRDSISHHTHLRATPQRRPWMLPLAPVTARRLARALKPDIVHGLYLSGYGWTAHALRSRPLVLSALGSDVLDLDRRTALSFPPGAAATAYGVWRTRRAVAAADVVFADSAAIADAVARQVPGTNTRIVRFGVAIRPATPTARSEWRRRLRVDENDFVALSSRVIRANYNIDTIIRAFAEIREQIPGSVLVLKEYPPSSDVEYRRHCFELIDEFDLGDAVRTVGELEPQELLELHAAADVYLSVPSRDGTAVSVLEAMAAGAAVVASDAPGIDPEILRARETALLVPPGDSAALASAVVALAREGELRARLVRRAAEIVRLYGDFDRELDGAVELYEELVGSVVEREP
jgi:glycosyltransferase involved in cell wall biosynthesis